MSRSFYGPGAMLSTLQIQCKKGADTRTNDPINTGFSHRLQSRQDRAQRKGLLWPGLEAGVGKMTQGPSSIPLL